MGFPDRPTRIDFGPNMKNVRAPVISETDLSADQMNLTFWQTAGAGRTVPMAVFLYDGTTPTLIFQALAFDPRQELAPIATAKNGTGDYTFTFASTYKNEQGVDRPFVPRFAMTSVQGGVAGDKSNPNVNGQDVQVIVRDSSEMVTDGTFVLAVW